MTKHVFTLTFHVALASGAILSAGCGGDDSTTTTPGNDASTADGSSHDGGASDSSMSQDSSMGMDSSPAHDSGGGDADTDGGTPFGDAGVMCGNTTCMGGQVCCATFADGGMSATETCMASCPDGGVTLMCDSPAQCNSTNPICCATLSVGAGNPPNCPFQSGMAACASMCTTQIPTSCPGQGKVRLCRAKADCAGDSQNPNCCTFTQGGQTATFCANGLIANFGQCHP